MYKYEKRLADVGFLEPNSVRLKMQFEASVPIDGAAQMANRHGRAWIDRLSRVGGVFS